MAKTSNVHRVIGASGHTKEEREKDDYYATNPIAGELLLQIEDIKGKIWEPACGEKYLSNVFEKHGYEVRSSDLRDRCNNEVLDFLDPLENEKWNGNIITNPPFKYAVDFIEKSLRLIEGNHKVCMFLKTQFLESKGRKKLFLNTPPKTVWITSSRISCSKTKYIKDGKFPGSAISYAWYIWEPGFKGTTQLKWFN